MNEDETSVEGARAGVRSIVDELKERADSVGGEVSSVIRQAIGDAASVAQLINAPDVSLDDKIDALRKSVHDPVSLQILIDALVESEAGTFGPEGR